MPGTRLQRLRGAYAALAPAAHAGFIGHLLALLACIVVAGVMVTSIAGDVAIAVFWTPAEAVIVGQPRVGPPEQRRGHAHWARLLADLPDGRQVAGDAMRPIFDRIQPSGAPDGTVQRRSPSAGDRIRVHVSPGLPVRIMPSSELNSPGRYFVLLLCMFIGGMSTRWIATALRKAGQPQPA